MRGSAPDIAGRGIENPSGLLVAATQMLVHLGEGYAAERVKNAWLTTLESGIHTADMYRPDLSQREVGTADFADAVIARLGEEPRPLQPVRYGQQPRLRIASPPVVRGVKHLVGVDVFLDWAPEDREPKLLGKRIEAAVSPLNWDLKLITNRGVKVYPEGFPGTALTDHSRCRFLPIDDGPTTLPDVLSALAALHDAGLEPIKTEHLYTFDGRRAYSLGQGE